MDITYMVCRYLNKRQYFLIVGALVGLCILPSCAQHSYKAEADKRVYDIIDQKWQPEFGPKANYKISDVASSPNDIQVKRAVPSNGVLTLAQAVALATAHNREYQLQREMLYTMALDLRLTRHEFEMKYFGGLSGGYARDRNDEAWGLETMWGFNRLLSSGTVINTRLGSAWTEILMGNLSGGLSSILGMTVVQPLLRARDPNVVMEPLTQAERNTLYQVRIFSRFRKITVVSVITQYYQVLQLHDMTVNAKDLYEKLVWLRDRAEKLANAGRLPKYEVTEIKQRELNAWEDYIQAQEDYGQMFDFLKITMGVPTTEEFELDEKELDVLRAMPPNYPDFSVKDAVETSMYRRLDLANSADAIIDAQRQVHVAADALQSDANIVGEFDVVSGGRGSRQTLKTRENYNVDVGISLPLDRVLEQNVYRKALINLNMKQREYDLLADIVGMEVQQAYRELAESAGRYEVHREGLNVAEKRFKDTFALMKYSRASSRRVISALEDLRTARDGATEALVNYAIATLNFYRDTEILQVRPDGMWEKGGHLEFARDSLINK